MRSLAVPAFLDGDAADRAFGHPSQESKAHPVSLLLHKAVTENAPIGHEDEDRAPLGHGMVPRTTAFHEI